MTTGEALGPPLAASGSCITDVSFSPDGLHLATASLDRTGALWRLDGSRSIGVVRARQQGPTTEVHYTPDGRTLVTGSIDGSVVIADARTGAVRRTLHVDGEVRTIAIDRTGKRVAVGGTGGRVRVFDLATGATVAELPVGGGLVHQVAFDPTTDALAIAVEQAVEDGPSTGRVIIWDPVRDRRVGEPIALGAASPYAVAWAPDGKQIAVATDDTFVHFYRADARASRDRQAHRGRRQSVPRARVLARRPPAGDRRALGRRAPVVDRDHKPIGAPTRGNHRCRRRHRLQPGWNTARGDDARAQHDPAVERADRSFRRRPADGRPHAVHRSHVHASTTSSARVRASRPTGRTWRRRASTA